MCIYHFTILRTNTAACCNKQLIWLYAARNSCWVAIGSSGLCTHKVTRYLLFGIFLHLFYIYMVFYCIMQPKNQSHQYPKRDVQNWAGDGKSWRPQFQGWDFFGITDVAGDWTSWPQWVNRSIRSASKNQDGRSTFNFNFTIFVPHSKIQGILNGTDNHNDWKSDQKCSGLWMKDTKKWIIWIPFVYSGRLKISSRSRLQVAQRFQTPEAAEAIAWDVQKPGLLFLGVHQLSHYRAIGWEVWNSKILWSID